MPNVECFLSLRNECRNSILMTRHYVDLGSASDWSCHVGNLIQPIRSTTQIWIVTHHWNVEFLHLFPRRDSVGKPVAASPNVGCFLRLVIFNILFFYFFDRKMVCMIHLNTSVWILFLKGYVFIDKNIISSCWQLALINK